jgi:hypothetical protein
MVIDTLKPIQASNKFMSATVDGSNTTYKKAHTGEPCYEAKHKASKSLVYSKGVALTKLTKQLCKIAITTGSSTKQTDLITQLPSPKYFSWTYKLKQFTNDV